MKFPASQPTIRRYLKKLNFRHSKGEFVHPKKFETEEKISYYQYFLEYQICSKENHWSFCFQDESHIEKNGKLYFKNLAVFDFAFKKKDQGHYYIWNSHQFNRYRYKKTDCVEKYTISAVTSLNHEIPLIFAVIKGFSNGPHYKSFMINEVLPMLRRGDTIIVDNQNYHVKGSGDPAKEIKLLIVNLVFKKGKHAEAIQIKCQEMVSQFSR